MNMMEKIKAVNLSDAVVVDEKKKYGFVGSTSKPAMLSIVNHDCGQRITFSSKAYMEMGRPEFVRLLLRDDFIIIEGSSHECKGAYSLNFSKKNKNKPILYGREIVRKITDFYGLDFNGRSTWSFYEGEVYEDRLYVNVAREDIDDGEAEADGDSYDCPDSEEETDDYDCLDSEEETDSAVVDAEEDSDDDSDQDDDFDWEDDEEDSD